MLGGCDWSENQSADRPSRHQCHNRGSLTSRPVRHAWTRRFNLGIEGGLLMRGPRAIKLRKPRAGVLNLSPARRSCRTLGQTPRTTAEQFSQIQAPYRATACVRHSLLCRTLRSHGISALPKGLPTHCEMDVWWELLPLVSLSRLKSMHNLTFRFVQRIRPTLDSNLDRDGNRLDR